MIHIFDQIPDDKLPLCYELLGAISKEYKKGDFLLLPHAKLSAFGLIERGAIEVLHLDADSNVVLMAKVTKGQTFGEALSYLGSEASVEIRALADTKVLWLRVSDMEKRVTAKNASLLPLLQKNFTSLVCARSLILNQRIQILSKLTLREKILAMLVQNDVGHGEAFNTQMNREELSLYLGTNRSALSRELSRMQADGLISINGNTIILK